MSLSGDGPFQKAVEDAVKSSDVIHVDVVKANLPNFSYQVNDMNYLGLKDCAISNMKVEKDKSNFQFDLVCPKIIITGHYEAKGSLLDQMVNGNGKMKITVEGYLYTVICNYEEKNDENNKPYIHIKDFEVKKEPKGSIVFGLGNLSDGDAEKSEALFKYFNANWKKMEEVVRNPALDAVFAVFIENLNKNLKAMPVN
uniref:SFRICE_023205 n=1 Tax=Spodoptera frugiperda TaxID=7108 RepID=A0A2H1WF65_SPOFR